MADPKEIIYSEISDKDVSRFRKRAAAAVHTENGCMEWQASKNPSGYGYLRLSRKMVRAHRLAWVLHHKKTLPADKIIRHLCNNPSCVNPEHLAIGTHADNHVDMAYARSVAGSKNSQAKLTDEQVTEIRAKYQRGKVTYQQLADEYGVVKQTIGNIINSDSWGNKPYTHSRYNPKGNRDMRGERNGRAKVTKEKVAQIRKLYQHKGVTQQLLADDFGLSTSMISYIVRGDNWK